MAKGSALLVLFLWGGAMVLMPTCIIRHSAVDIT